MSDDGERRQPVLPDNVATLGVREKIAPAPATALDVGEDHQADGATAGAGEQTKIPPGQAVAAKLLAIRNALVAHNDKIATVLLSIYGSKEAPPARAPLQQGVEHRRFFPAVVRLNMEIDAEVERLGELADRLDRAF